MNILHLGAHRTASSTTQMCLVRMAEAGDLPGWRIFGPEQIRRRLTRLVDVVSRAPFLANPLLGRAAAADLMTALDDERVHCVLSDENLLGPVDPAILGGRGLYPDAGRYLKALRRLLGARRDLRVVLAVRNYADWRPSAYAMMALRRPLPPVASLAPGWLTPARRWDAVVRDVVAEFGGCDVLCYEALEQDPHAHLRNLVGEAAEAAPHLRLHQSFSADALARIAALTRRGAPPTPDELRSLRREDRRNERGQNRGQERGQAGLVVFSPEERRRLTELYIRDLARMPGLGARMCAPPPERLD